MSGEPVDLAALGGALDAGFPHRLLRLWGLREFFGVQLAVRQADAAEFDDAVRKLRRGPILGRQSSVVSRQ
jgi:hypothetical protein